MTSLRVFDPALCCASGVCGTSVDPELARFAVDLEWLKAQGVAVERFNLAHQPGAFIEPAVKGALEGMGEAALPLVMLGGAVVATGHYPSREVLCKLTGLGVTAKTSSCCAPKGTSNEGGSCC